MKASRPGDPRLQILAAGHGAGGIVRRAEVGEVDAPGGRRWREAVLFGGGQVEDAGVTAVVVGLAGSTRHDVGVDVDGIHGVGYGDAAVLVEDLLDVAAVLLAAVGDEDLVGLDGDAARAVVVLLDQLEQERVAVLGSVAVEAGLGAERDGGVAQRLDDGRCEWQRDVADAEADHPGFGVALGERRHASPDLGEEVARLELAVVLVDARHGGGA
jgi:hypothetical protein